LDERGGGKVLQKKNNKRKEEEYPVIKIQGKAIKSERKGGK